MTLFLRTIYISTFLSLFYIILLYLSDTYRKESTSTISLVFVLGMFAVLPVTLLHKVFPGLDEVMLQNSVLNVIFRDYVRAGLVEELIKSLFFIYLLSRFKYGDFAEVMDGIVYFGILGAGFAVYEDFWYIFQNSYPPWEAGDFARFNQVYHQMILSRAFPGHILFDCLAGYFFSLSKFSQRRWSKVKLLSAGFLIAVLAHGTFNFIAQISDAISLLIYILFLILILVGLRTHALKISPFKILLKSLKEGRLDTEISARYFYYPIEKYLFDRDAPWRDKPKRNPWRFVPMLIILVPLYPLVFLLIFYLNRFLLNMF